MSWDSADYNNVIEHNAKNIGQVDLDSYLGKFLNSFAKNEKYTTFLEIGTWNGLGSTKCIVDGLLTRKTPFTFYSLECNSEKVKMAQKLYADISGVHILDEVLLSERPANMTLIFPELLTNTEFAEWNKIDFENMREKPLFLNRLGLPDVFDVVLLDGGEFTTWYEYNLIKDRCKILLLDDTRVSKCKKIVSDILDQPHKWKVLLNSKERNGTFACMRI
jgi:hypothetical protein